MSSSLLLLLAWFSIPAEVEQRNPWFVAGCLANFFCSVLFHGMQTPAVDPRPTVFGMLGSGCSWKMDWDESGHHPRRLQQLRLKTVLLWMDRSLVAFILLQGSNGLTEWCSIPATGTMVLSLAAGCWSARTTETAVIVALVLFLPRYALLDWWECAVFTAAVIGAGAVSCPDGRWVNLYRWCWHASCATIIAIGSRFHMRQ